MKTSNTSVMTSAVRRSGFRGAAVLGVILGCSSSSESSSAWLAAALVPDSRGP